MVFPMLVSFALKENQHLWFLTMLAVAIFSALTIYLQFLFTRERVTEEGRADTEIPAKSATLGEQLKPLPVTACGGSSWRSICCSSGAAR